MDAMTEGNNKPSLDKLDAQIKAAQQQAGLTQRQKMGKDSGKGKYQALSFAIRLGTELVASLIIGVGVGFLLDHWLGTGPWFMIAFFFLGAAAGIMNVYRTAMGYDSGVGYQRPEKKNGNEEESGLDRD